MATVKFEKYNDGKPFRTVFYTGNKDNMDTTIEYSAKGDNSGDIIFSQAKMTSDEKDITSSDTLTIRSYEVYVDVVDGDNDEAEQDIIVTRMAKVTKDSSNTTNYDVYVKENTITGDKNEFDISIKNLTGSDKTDVRVVLVCEVTN